MKKVSNLAQRCKTNVKEMVTFSVGSVTMQYLNQMFSKDAKFSTLNCKVSIKTGLIRTDRFNDIYSCTKRYRIYCQQSQWLHLHTQRIKVHLI